MSTHPRHHHPVSACCDVALGSLLLVCTTLSAPSCSDTIGHADIADAEVHDNPACLLTCRVTWTTDQPASSWVHFGEIGGERRFRTGSDAENTDHDVLVLGMHADADYEIQAVSSWSGGEVRSELLSFTTGSIPFESAVFDLVVHEPDRMQPGWTLVNLVVGNPFPPTVVALLDDLGEMTWYHTFGAVEGFSGIQASMVDDGHILIGGNVPPGKRPRLVDLSGTILWEGPLQPDEPAQDGSLHHVFEALPDGHYLGMMYDFDDGFLKDIVFEIDEELNTLWQWHVEDHIPEAAEQSLHGNMAQLDPTEDSAYFNSRNLSALYKLDRGTHELLWELGEGRDFEMLGDHPDPWFLRAHAPEFLEGGNLLLHDNGSSGRRPYSRIMEYEVDQQALTIRPVWQYPEDGGADIWFSSVWGDADRLANGNTLFATGSVFDDEDTGRVVEVTPSGEVVWEIEMTAPDGDPAGTYMVERVPPIVEELP
jgi:hypothetical protein